MNLLRHYLPLRFSLKLQNCLQQYNKFVPKLYVLSKCITLNTKYSIHALYLISIKSLIPIYEIFMIYLYYLYLIDSSSEDSEVDV